MKAVSSEGEECFHGFFSFQQAAMEAKNIGGVLCGT